MYMQMAECARPCGWLGPAHERKARDDATEPFYCPKCAGPTRTWVADQAGAQEDLLGLQAARSKASQVSRDAYRQSRVAHARLHEAKQQARRCELLLAMTEADSFPEATRCLQARQNLLAAQQVEAEAGLAVAAAKARVRALG